MIEIFAEQTLGEFYEESGLWARVSEGQLFPIESGNTYTVVWDGIEYVTTVVELEESINILGNPQFLGEYEDTGEPFVYYCIPAGMMENDITLSIIATIHTGESHTIALYQTEGSTNTRDIISNRTLSGFSYSSSFGAYLYNQIPATFSFVPGETYKVLWDGVEYTLVTRAYISADGNSCVGMGNELLFGGENSGEPFGIVWNTELNYGHFFSLETTESHTVHVYQEIEVTPDPDPEPTPEPEAEGVSIVLYDRLGAPVTYEDVDTITTDTPESGEQVVFTYGEVVNGVEVELDLQNGNQTLSVPYGNLLRKAVIKKPDTLIPENIRKDVSIGGVTGTLVGTGVEKTVDLNMVDGDQIIEADEDTLMSKVVVTKPKTLVPENILKGVNIGGVVGSASTGLDDEEWLEEVVFWDFDGSMVARMTVAEASKIKELPTPPSHDGLTFQGWNFTLEEIRNANHILDVGAIYIPTDRKTHMTINIASSSYLNVILNFKQTVSDGVIIDWGDGSASTTISGTGEMTVGHSYSKIGVYEITFTIQDGCVMTLGKGTASTGLISDSTIRTYVTHLYIGNNVEFSAYGLYYFRGLDILTIPNGVKTIPERLLYYGCALSSVVLPNSVEEIGTYAVYNVGYYYYVQDKMPPISLPNSILSIGDYAFGTGYTIRRMVFPDSITALPNAVCSGNYKLKKVYYSENVTHIGERAFSSCYQLRGNVFVPKGQTDIPAYCFSGCYSLTKLEIPEGVVSVADYGLSNLRSINMLILPESLETIGQYCIHYVYGLKTLVIKSCIKSLGLYSIDSRYCHIENYIFTNPTPSTVLKSFNSYCNIYVPDESVEAYKSAINSDYRNLVQPISKYLGKLP